MASVDIVKFLNQLTGDDLLGWKVVLATVVIGLAGIQVALASRFWGLATFPPISQGAAVRIHRYTGRIAVLLGLLVGFSCVVGPAGPTSPTRVLIHSIAGSAVFVILAAKLTVLKVMRTGDRYLPILGLLLFMALAAVWATSVADYVAAR